MDRAREPEKTSGSVANRVVDEYGPLAVDKSGTSDRGPSANAADRTMEKRGTTGDGGPEVNDENGNDSDMPRDELDDSVVSEGRSKIFRLEGAVYSIGSGW
ncbi:uncharacterized protein LOC132924685 [Rhopalosiphum padi]|uniref:uncharacterized protein LOC132924685 n=1 Tax=Rhopalosiphum padi TaxID=40932 RepID=UPI00298E7962|nr:uncharacterized protein LOC132924685 [Rhopalosiphum padi]